MSDFGKLLMLFGAALVALGALLAFAGTLPWLGKLPGDLHYQSERGTFYFPLATCVVISVVLSLLFWLFRR